MIIKFYLPPGVEFTPRALDVIREAKTRVFGSEQIEFDQAREPGRGVISFGAWHRDAINTASVMSINYLMNAVAVVERAFRDYRDGQRILTPFDCADDEVLYFDIESHSVDERWNLPPREFFRLGQYAWGPTGEVVLTESYDEVIDAIRSAYGVVGHNIHDFDLSVLFGADSIEPLEMARDGRVYDTFVHATLAMPSPDQPYTLRNGRQALANKPEAIRKWLSLDNLCYQLGLSGKVEDLKALAAEYGGFCHIPLDDPRFRRYAVQDVVAAQELSCALLDISPFDAYDAREQLTAGITAQMSRNGFRVDLDVARRRVSELAERKANLLGRLEAEYDFPTTGKQPWRSTAGKAAIMRILADNGITPETRPSWPKTKTGMSLGGDVMKEITQGTAAEDLGEALAELMGQRSLAQLAIDCTQDDGKVHPEVTSLQRSGRFSVTSPGLTVWSARGPKAVEKSYFVPDSTDERLIGMDLSNADQRIVAALSGDVEYAKRFDEGVDGHEINGRAMFTDEVYDTDPKKYRTAAKAPGHASTYGAGPKKLAATTGLPLATMERFLFRLAEMYPDMTRWQQRVRKLGESGMLVNDWGRRMVLDPSKSHTVSPALMGQSGTREKMVDALIAMLHTDVRYIRWVKALVHDELIFSVPLTEAEVHVPRIRELMGRPWGPTDGTGQVIDFPASTGPLAENWFGATHD